MRMAEELKENKPQNGICINSANGLAEMGSISTKYSTVSKM